MQKEQILKGIPLEETKRMEEFTSFQTVDFGSVEPGRTYVKEISLSGSYDVTDVTSTTLSNPLDKAITLEKKDKTFFFTFKPTLPGQASNAIYYLSFSDKTRQALVAKGQTKRTSSILSKSRLYFAASDKHPVTEFLIQLENTSDASDYFQWDSYDDYNGVTVKPKCGKLKPKDKVKIFIRVRPTYNSLFWRQIFCLMKFQEPIVLEIFGVYTNNPEKPDLGKVIQLNETLPSYRTTFCRYVGDYWREIFLESRPLLAINHRYIHFGAVKKNEIMARVFKVTNHGLQQMTISWGKDKQGVFSIEPHWSVIQSRATQTFVVKFVPQISDQFYCKDLLATVIWGSKLDFLVPFTLSIGLAGNSFSTNGCSWGLFYKLDRTRIVLPATVPGIPSYTTFQLTKRSELPVFFRLYPADPRIPPERSAFLVKPMQGLVTGDFQIIVVQMFPGDVTDVDLIEEWILSINTSEKLPYVLISNNKLVEFPATTIGVDYSLSVPIRNTTRLTLKCLALMEPNAQEFALGPGEQTTFPICFNPKEGPQEFEWAVTLDVIWNHGDKNVDKLLLGELITARTVVKCKGRSVVACVEGNPQSITMNNVIIRRANKTLVKVQNNGEGVVYLGLTIEPSAFGTENSLITLTPDELIIKPEESRQVEVSFMTKKVGRNSFKINGTFYESALFRKKISDAMLLVFIDLFSAFPSLKVIDLQYKGLICNTSKLTLWSLLRINQLNEALKNASSMKAQSCCMRFPSSGQASESLRVQLLLQSTTEVPLTMSITRVKSCKCRTDCSSSISRRKQICICPHNNEILVRLSKNELKPCEKAVLTFVVNYDEPQEEPFKFILTIGTTSPSNLKTRMTLLVTRPVFSMATAKLDLNIPPVVYDKASTTEDPQSDGCVEVPNSYRWILEPLCVNENSKYIQILWLHNESVIDTSYSVEWKFVDPKIFHLINPRGVVTSFSIHPVFLMCSPCEFKEYSAEMVIRARPGLEEFTVRVELTVATNPVYDTRRMLNKMPPKALFDRDDLDLELSQDHMCLPPLPTHSYTRQIFFMKNRSEDTIKFEWLECKVWSVLEAEVSPAKGVLKPQEVRPCMIQIKSFRFPVKCSFTLTYLVINISKYKEYWACSKLHKRASSLFDAAFTLTDSKNAFIGSSFQAPESGVHGIEKPQIRFASLGVSVQIFNRDQIEFLFPKLYKQLEFPPDIRAEIDSPPENVLVIKKPDIPDVILQVMRTAFSQILKSAPFKLTYKNEVPVVKYAPITTQGKVNRSKTLQNYFMGSLLSRAVYASVIDIFALSANEDFFLNDDKRIEVTETRSRSKGSLNNLYYRDILKGKFFQVGGNRACEEDEEKGDQTSRNKR